MALEASLKPRKCGNKRLAHSYGKVSSKKGDDPAPAEHKKACFRTQSLILYVLYLICPTLSVPDSSLDPATQQLTPRSHRNHEQPHTEQQPHES